MARAKEELQTTAEVNKAAEEGKEVVQASPTYTTLNVNKTDTMGNRVSETDIKKELEEAKKKLKAKAVKSVSIPKQLASVLGDTLPACINGVCIRVPVDGEEYDVPAPYVDLIRNSLKTINSGDVRSTLQHGNIDPEGDLLVVRK
jgi:hypothetical protein